MVRHGDWKLQVTARPDAVWLDLAAVHGQFNLADTRLIKSMSCAGCWRSTTARRPPLYPRWRRWRLPWIRSLNPSRTVTNTFTGPTEANRGSKANLPQIMIAQVPETGALVMLSDDNIVT